jgi:hypothetical protein
MPSTRPLTGALPECPLMLPNLVSSPSPRPITTAWTTTGSSAGGAPGNSPVMAAIGSYLLAARRLPGVYAGAQPRLSARERRACDICDFQDFRVLRSPRCATGRSLCTTHNREVGGSNPPGAIRLVQRNAFLEVVATCRAAIHSVVRSSTRRVCGCRARTEAAPCHPVPTHRRGHRFQPNGRSPLP